MLLLLARLGLRANEIATLTLGDIDWHSGHLTVRGKGRRQMGSGTGFGAATHLSAIAPHFIGFLRCFARSR